MEKKLKLCNYPRSGFGGKCNAPYLLDRWGCRYDFENEWIGADKAREWYVTINGHDYWGGPEDGPMEIVETMKEHGWDIAPW